MGTGSAKAYAHSEQGGGFEAIRGGGNGQLISFSSGAIQSNAFSGKTTIVRLFSTKDCWLSFGSNPTITGSTFFMPGGIIDYIGVDGGWKIQVQRDTADGILYIAEGG